VHDHLNPDATAKRAIVTIACGDCAPYEHRRTPANTAATTRSQRVPWNWNAPVATARSRNVTARRSMARARCKRIFTASSPKPRPSPDWTFNAAKHEHDPIVFRQRIHRRFQHPAELLAGVDTFSNLLTDWPAYLSPIAAQILPLSTSSFMYGIEMLVGLVILAGDTRLGGYVAAIWLVGIAANLVTTGHYFDIAVREVIMAIAAFTLARITEARPSEQVRNDVRGMSY
jgi:hypothetical protein